MTRPDPHPPEQLAADDPRVSEWIDGRLPAAEAADIERAVRDSPALARLVADLRAIKAAVAGLAASTPVAPDFAARVAAAARQTGSVSEIDPAVEHEWRRVEAERIAEERLEASADAAERPADRPRRWWSFLAIAGALAAGILVTVLANRPREGMRDVAIAPAGGTASRPPAADALAVAPASRRTDEEQGRFAATNGDRSEREDVGARLESRPAEPAADQIVSAPAAATTDSADGQAGEMADDEAVAEVVEIEVLGPGGRAAFDRLLAASGLEVVGGPEAVRAFGAGSSREPLLRRSADRAAEGASEKRAPPSGGREEESAAGAQAATAAAARESAGPVAEAAAGLADAAAATGGGRVGQGRAVPPDPGAGVFVLQGSPEAIEAFLADIEPAGVDLDGVGRLRVATGQRLQSGVSQRQLQQQRSRQGQGPVQQQVVRLIDVPDGLPRPPAQAAGPDPAAPAEPAPSPAPALPGAPPATPGSPP